MAASAGRPSLAHTGLVYGVEALISHRHCLTVQLPQAWSSHGIQLALQGTSAIYGPWRRIFNRPSSLSLLSIHSVSSSCTHLPPRLGPLGKHLPFLSLENGSSPHCKTNSNLQVMLGKTQPGSSPELRAMRDTGLQVNPTSSQMQVQRGL